MIEFQPCFPTEEDMKELPEQAIIAGLYAIADSSAEIEHGASAYSRSMVFYGLDARRVIQDSSELERTRRSLIRQVGLSAARAWMADHRVGAAAS